MKKIIFTLLALVGTMSMNAQVMQIYNGETLVKEYKASEATHVVFKEAPAFPFGQGEAAATGIGNVKWIQLWENGPKFAEYNVGATSATEYGGYYTWGGKYKNEIGIAWNGSSNYSSDALTGTDDTANYFWGENWRMPTKVELEGLLNSDNCDFELTNDYNGTGIIGIIFTGKNEYSSNSVFLPAAGCCIAGGFQNQDKYGYYWASTINTSENKGDFLYFRSDLQIVGTYDRSNAHSVRAVLKETPATTGVSKATIGGVETDVNWVQLWEGGPKFAEYNVGASSATDLGITMTFTEATSAEYVWGANWCTPSKDDMEHLMTAAKGETDEKVKCEYTQENSVWGLKFTGLTDGYTDNSVFFPVQSDNSDFCYERYWSATAYGDRAWDMNLYYNYGNLNSYWDLGAQDIEFLVRPVLKN